MAVRRLAAATVAALTAGVLVATPAPAAAATPVPLHARDAAQPVYDIGSGPSGTVFATTGGEVRLVRAPLTPAAAEVPLGRRGDNPGKYPAQEVSVQGGRVAVPLLPKPAVTYQPVLPTRVRWCLVADCPTTSTLTVPAGYRYLGNAGDVAIVHRPATNTLGLLPWSGGAMRTVSLGAARSPLGAYGDRTGIVLWHPGRAMYVARPSLTVTTLNGRLAYLTPSYVVYVSVGSSTYSIHRVPRATPSAAGTVTTVPQPSGGGAPTRLVATDESAAWSMPLPFLERTKTADQVEALRTMAFGEQPVDAGHVEWRTFAPFEDTADFLVHRSDPQGRSFYRVDAATGTAVPAHTLPARQATARSIWVSDDRVAYTDDATIGGAAYYRDVTDGAPGAETLVKDNADTVSLSAAYIAVGKHPVDLEETAGAGFEHDVVAGRVDGDLSHRTSYGDPVLSGHRLVTQRPTGVERDSLRVLDRYYRGGVTGTVYGDYYYAADRDGGIQRRDLRTGALTTVRAASCGGCGTDQSRWQLWGWGDELLYALDLGAQGRVTGRWDASAGTTTPLPMLSAGWTRLAYRAGLLLVHRTGDGVRLHNLRNGASALVDAAGDLPYGNGLGNAIVAWRDASGRAVVAPISDFLPGYDPETRYLNGVAPRGFLADPGKTWDLEWYLTDDSAWQLQLRQGGHTGAVVRRMAGTTQAETVTVRWDGTDGDGDPAPAGWYAWRLTTDAGMRSGTFFLSRETPPTPTLDHPVLTSDWSATDQLTITWDGAPPGHRYALVGPSSTLYTTAESRTYTGLGAVTIRRTLYVEDPAGRRSAPARMVTVTPADDETGNPFVSSQWARSSASQHWLGSQQRSSTPGARYGFWARGDALWLIGAKGPAYGRYRVTVDGRSWTYDAYSPVVKFRQVLFKVAGLPDVTHRVVVEVLATPGRTRVGVDGLAARRPVPRTGR